MIQYSKLPTQAVLRRFFSYDQQSGLLRWRVPRGRSTVGDEAGSPNKDGYKTVGLNGKNYKVHRIIWKLVTGNAPAEQIDHVDLDRANNRWINLREATCCENKQNSRTSASNSSGVKGVSYNKSERKWEAYIMAERRFVFLGRFKTLEKATSAVADVRVKMHGDFARAA
jgi:hypothetical protein